ncbi:MAG TPA: 30S ribosomal protein S6 [Vicinamibacterales bacterium]|nr:30S ribosomal protein S6 [Vicinamibacterales bacterium]
MSDRQYELVYIITPDATDQQVAEVHEQVSGIVSRLGGRIDKTDNWGRRKLAYEIARRKEGIYVLEAITGSGELMKEIDRRLKVTDQIIRHLVVRVDEQQKVLDRVLAQRQADVARRRERRGLSPEAPGEAGTPVRRRDRDDDDDDQDDQEAEV